jgi:hypothetical protein
MATSELKFFVTQDIAAELRKWVRLELHPDPNAAAPGGDTYRTTTLYFDTNNLDLFFRRGSHGRAKFRIRTYDGHTAFLERKVKAGDRILKRRSDVAESDLMRICSTTDEDWPGRWFARRLHLRGLRPVCQVVYVRTARVGQSPDGALRLTIDEEVRTAAVDTIAFTNAPGVEVVGGHAILELKYRGTIPPLFDQMVSEFDLHPQLMSKYRMSVRALGLERTDFKTEEKFSLLDCLGHGER